MVVKMTRGSCILTDSVKSGDDDYSSLIHNIEIGSYIDSDKIIRHTWLVKVMSCLVGDIPKRDRDEIWICICIEKIIVIIHITQEQTKNKQTNK